jgi:hypothetical protein
MIGQNYNKVASELIEEAGLGFITLSCGCPHKINPQLLKMAADKWSDLVVGGVFEAVEYYHKYIQLAHI